MNSYVRRRLNKKYGYEHYFEVSICTHYPRGERPYYHLIVRKDKVSIINFVSHEPINRQIVDILI